MLMANNEIMLRLLEEGQYELARNVVAWYLNAAKAYGIKGRQSGWRRSLEVRQRRRADEPTGTGFREGNAGDIVTNLARIIDDLGLPHPIHLHCNNLGAPGNVATTLETMKYLRAAGPHCPHAIPCIRRG